MTKSQIDSKGMIIDAMPQPAPAMVRENHHPEEAMVATHAQCYRLLGVSPNSTMTELYQAFRRRAHAAHPSLGGGSAKAFNALGTAFEVLSTLAAHGQGDGSLLCTCDEVQSSGDHATTVGTAVLESCDSGHDETVFLPRLYGLLQQLPPAARREAIARRLTQAQRLALERWMAARRGGGGGVALLRAQRLSGRSLCQDGRGGFRPLLHLAGGIYAQAARTSDLRSAVASFGALVAIRAHCCAALRQAAPVAAADGKAADAAGLFEQHMLAGLMEALSSCEVPGASLRLRFRLRISLGRGCELATPTRCGLIPALQDWRRFYEAATAAGGWDAGGHDAGVAARLARLSVTWMELWSARGRPLEVLKDQLTAKAQAVAGKAGNRGALRREARRQALLFQSHGDEGFMVLPWSAMQGGAKKVPRPQADSDADVASVISSMERLLRREALRKFWGDSISSPQRRRPVPAATPSLRHPRASKRARLSISPPFAA